MSIKAFFGISDNAVKLRIWDRAGRLSAPAQRRIAPDRACLALHHAATPSLGLIDKQTLHQVLTLRTEKRTIRDMHNQLNSFPEISGLQWTEPRFLVSLKSLARLRVINMIASGNLARGAALIFFAGSLFLGMFGRTDASDGPFPAKPIRIVIPYQPGGGSDLSVRLMKDYLAKEFGVPIVFENLAGARGTIGTVSALRATPDGYTLLYGADGIVTGPLMSPNPPYELFRDLVPICHYGFLPIAYGVRANSQFKTIEELVTFAKAVPGRLSWGVTNFGGMSHLSVELFKKEARIDAKIVPFKGTGEAITALLGGHINVQSLSYGAFQAYVSSGDVRILAVTDSLPGQNLPLLSSAGYSRVSMSLFNGFFASARVPRPIYDGLVTSFERVATNPELRKRWEQMGIVPDFKGPQSFTAFLKERQRITSMLIDELQLKKQ